MSPTGVSPLLDLLFDDPEAGAPVAYATISPNLDATKRAEDAVRESEEWRAVCSLARAGRGSRGRTWPRLNGLHSCFLMDFSKNGGARGGFHLHQRQS